MAYAPNTVQSQLVQCGESGKGVMQYTKSSLLAAVAFTVTLAGPVDATTFTYSATVDLAPGTHSSVLGFDVFHVGISGAPSFPLLQGDTISGTITFANN